MPYKKSVFDKILLKASQCHPKCHCFNGVNFFLEKCNIFSIFLLTLHVVMPLLFKKFDKLTNTTFHTQTGIGEFLNSLKSDEATGFLHLS